MDTAKVFWSGRSQAVRLPKEYRVIGKELKIRRVGNAIILEPIENNWDWLAPLQGPVDEDFRLATEETVPMQEREGLTALFDE